jgi:CDP-6-deoxy-D-xylo-4-hexulose-3-dehydrase
LKDYDEIVDHKYIFTNMGYNLKPLDLQGAMGVVQLEKFDEIHERRINSKNHLHKIIEECVPNVYLPEELEYAETSWFGTPIVCDNKEQKNDLVKYFEEIKVQTRNYFAGNILLHPGYRHLDDYSQYPNSNKVLDKVFFIGASPHYDDVIFNYVREKLVERYQ